MDLFFLKTIKPHYVSLKVQFFFFQTSWNIVEDILFF